MLSNQRQVLARHLPVLDEKLGHQLAIISSVLLLVILLAHQTTSLSRNLLLVIGLVGGASFVWLVTRYPALGPMAFIVASLLIPIGVGTGSQSQINATMLVTLALVGLWSFNWLASHSSKTFRWSAPYTPLFLLILAVILSFFIGQLPWFFTVAAPMRAQIGGSAIFVLSAAAYLIAAQYINDVRGLSWLTWTYLGLGVLFIVGRVLPGRFPEALIVHSATGSLFWVWLVTLSFSQAWLNKNLNVIVRLALFGITALTLYVGLSQGRSWISGWLPALVGLATMFALRQPRLIALPAVAGSLIAAFNINRIATVIVQFSNDQYSYLTRLEAGRIVLEIAQASPILGLGPANYYWYTPLYPILGYPVQFNSHNQYVDLIAQVGWLGLILFLWFMWRVAKLGWQLRHKTTDSFAEAHIFGVLGGLAGMLTASALGDWVLPFVYNIGFAGFRISAVGWLFLGTLTALQHLLETEKAI